MFLSNHVDPRDWTWVLRFGCWCLTHCATYTIIPISQFLSLYFCKMSLLINSLSTCDSMRWCTWKPPVNDTSPLRKMRQTAGDWVQGIQMEILFFQLSFYALESHMACLSSTLLSFWNHTIGLTWHHAPDVMVISALGMLWFLWSTRKSWEWKQQSWCTKWKQGFHERSDVSQKVMCAKMSGLTEGSVCHYHLFPEVGAQCALVNTKG